MSQLPISLDGIIKTPPGTKLWLLNLGDLECDIGFLLRSGSASSLSNPVPKNERRQLAMISVLISHPTEGLILYETGAGKDYPEIWGPPVNDVFARVNYQPEHELKSAIAATGNDIKDIKAIIIGHLHIDHAGGLDEFRNTDIPVYVHESEIKAAFYSVATKTDLGVYMPHYLQFDINWQSWHGDSLEIAQGLTVRHSPGHTPGLAILQVNMNESGTWIFTSDQYHIRENWEMGLQQGWLARDHDAWCRSHQMIRALAKRTNAKVVLGHEKGILQQYQKDGTEFHT